MDLKEEVKKLIEHRNNSLPELAQISKTSKSTLQRVLKGQHVSEGTLLKLKARLS